MVGVPRAYYISREFFSVGSYFPEKGGMGRVFLFFDFTDFSFYFFDISEWKRASERA